MKSFQMIIFIILGALAGIFLYSQFQPKPDNTAEVKRLKAEQRELKKDAERYITEIGILQHRVDSLKTLPQKIDTQIVYLQAEVDSIIAIDSSNAITEYRKGLKLLDIRPESTPELTLREIGYGGLTFRETHGLRLKVNYLYDVIGEQDNLIDKQGNLIEIKDNIIQSDSLIIAGQDLLIKEKDSFWRNRIVWTLGIYYIYIPDNQKTGLGIGTGIGIRLWGNK